MKSKSTIFLLWLFFGVFGGHRFYVGKTMSGILFALTFGFFFIGVILDFFRLGSMVDDYNLRFAVLHGGANQNNNANANTNMNNIVINMPAQQTAPTTPASQQESTPSTNA